MDTSFTLCSLKEKKSYSFCTSAIQTAHAQNSPFTVILNNYTVYTNDLHTRRLLLTHITVSYPYAILCILTRISGKLQVAYGRSVHIERQLYYRKCLFWGVRAACKIQLATFGSIHSSQFLLIQHLCVLPRISWKLLVICGGSAYWTTALLSEIFLVWFRVAREIWLESYGPRHA